MTSEYSHSPPRSPSGFYTEGGPRDIPPPPPYTIYVNVGKRRAPPIISHPGKNYKSLHLPSITHPISYPITLSPLPPSPSPPFPLPPPPPPPPPSSKQEMMKYMQEQQMPWVALAFDSTVSDKLRVDYKSVLYQVHLHCLNSDIYTISSLQTDTHMHACRIFFC